MYDSFLDTAKSDYLTMGHYWALWYRKHCHPLLRSQLSSLLDHHMAYQCNVKKYGTVLYRYSGDLLHALNVTLAPQPSLPPSHTPYHPPCGTRGSCSSPNNVCVRVRVRESEKGAEGESERQREGGKRISGRWKREEELREGWEKGKKGSSIHLQRCRLHLAHDH